MSLLGSIDQGTSSTRFCVFDLSGNLVEYHQKEFSSDYPKEGWVEQDPELLLETVVTCMNKVAEKLESRGLSISQVKAIGITNQRETSLVWDVTTGKPLHKAIVWLDLRTSETVHKMIEKTPTKSKYHFLEKCGLPLATYFSAVKLRWMLDNATEDMKDSLQKGNLRFGTVDSWIIWNLTGGLNGGVLVTDVTNASRTMLMNLKTLDWDNDLCQFFDIPKSILPFIKSSSEIYGNVSSGPFAGLPIAGCAGDQQAALFGHCCFKPGEGKNTYGTGCFMLFNTGNTPVISSHGLLTTLAYKIGNRPQVYALEGSVAIAGAAVTWFRDNLGIIKSSSEINELASSVKDTGGVYFVPAFSGLFAPYWRDDARGIILGLTQYSNSGHIARALLESVCFQTKEILEAMKSDSGADLSFLKVDGGMTNSPLCMQTQADLLNASILRPEMKEATALGAALLAGLGVGLWNSEHEISETLQTKVDVFKPQITEQERTLRVAHWSRAIERSFNLAEDPQPKSLNKKIEAKSTSTSPSLERATGLGLEFPAIIIGVVIGYALAKMWK